jgi:hypothetical protein
MVKTPYVKLIGVLSELVGACTGISSILKNADIRGDDRKKVRSFLVALTKLTGVN